MPKSERKKFYAVHIGRQSGVYTHWKDCDEQVKGFPRSSFKRFYNPRKAKAFVEHGPSGLNLVESIPSFKNLVAEANEVPLQKGKDHKKRERRPKPLQVDMTQPGEEGWDVIYTDGACQANGKDHAVAGIGVWFGPNDPRCPGEQTNNRAELIALIRALETYPISTKRFLIKTDSNYSISCISDWLLNWQRNGWTTSCGAPVKNKELILYLSQLLDQRGLNGQPVKLVHVRGHRGVPGNEGADKLARQGKYLPHYERRFRM